MTTTPDPADVLDAFSQFYAVVLNTEWGGDRVRWSSTHKGWLLGRPWHPQWPRNSRWEEAPSGQAAPSQEDRDAAATVALSITRPAKGSWWCSRCTIPRPDQHFIAPNVHGEPELYCVHVPSRSVVSSSGGQGHKKHAGGPGGCHSVSAWIDVGMGSREPYVGPVAAYLYGQPLPADEVIDREWCDRCLGTASNVRAYAARTGKSEDDLAEEEAKRDLRALMRDLQEYVRDDDTR